jgi:hypothetical protein
MRLGPPDLRAAKREMTGPKPPVRMMVRVATRPSWRTGTNRNIDLYNPEVKILLGVRKKDFSLAVGRKFLQVIPAKAGIHTPCD